MHLGLHMEPSGKQANCYTYKGKKSNVQEILRLLEAVQVAEQLAIMQFKAHQKVNTELEEGNELADREAKEAGKGEMMIEGALIPDGEISFKGKPVCWLYFKTV